MRPRRSFSFVAFLVLRALGLCGCENAGYYAHLAAGQTHILLNLESIDGLLARSDLPPGRRARFEFIAAVRRFALDRIGLASSSAYTCFFDTGGRPVSWNLSASPPDRFEPYTWRFPLVGTVPYKGFFDYGRARREFDALRARGFDAMVRPVSAYSTLGFLPDPVLSTMLDYPEERLAELIVHELTHATVYARDRADFNESLATFVGRAGALEFLAARYGPESPQLAQARRRRRDAARFGAFMRTVIASLDSLYSSGLPRTLVLEQRGQVFARAKEHYKSMRPLFESSNYDAFLDWKLNNARLLSYRRYHRHSDLFEALYASRKRHLRRCLDAFQSCARAQNPWSCLRDSTAAPRRPL